MNIISKLVRRVKSRLVLQYGRYNQKWLANYYYKHRFHRNIDWENPRGFNEKIKWMSFYSDTTIWSLCSDKYRVREYLFRKGYDHLLVKLYGVWENASEIDFDVLPNSFVLKTNHGCGDVIVVNDKNNVDRDAIVKRIQKYLDTTYGRETAETHYRRIKPCVIAEELLINDSNFSTSIVDYKFYCFSGKPVNCGVFYNRDPYTHQTTSAFFDMEWNFHPEWQRPDKSSKGSPLPRPKNFDYMKRLCKELTSEFPFVRLDLYEVCGKVYFGEFTFTPQGGYGGSLNDNLFVEYGDMIVLPPKI